MIVLQGAMPDICKRCKKSGGLKDGLYLIHTEKDFVNFYCDGQSPKTCPIKGEIPDKHGRLIDADFYKNYALCVHNSEVKEYIPSDYIDIVPTVLEASNGTDN